METRENIWQVPKKECTYILRYFLPRPPYVTKETTQKRLEELILFCKRSKVGAIMLYCNFLQNWYYMPDTLEHTLVWAEEMKEHAGAIRQAGISFQLNFQVILGAHTGGVEMRNIYDWEYMIDQNGTEVQGCACPLGAKFRNVMGQQLKAWAGANPDVIWIDDDLRYHNHGHYRQELDWYCYCPKHLELFSKKYGKEMSREELAALVLQPGKAGDVYTCWLETLNESMSETAAWISGTIHNISPRTVVAQMTSLPDIHSAEGRNWGDFLSNISGKGYKPMIRPTFGPYSESMPLDFLSSYIFLDQMMAHTAQQWKGEVDMCPEIENTRFTRWAKSGAATRFQLVLGQLMGCPGITLSIFDLEGTSLEEEPLYEQILTEEKPVLDSLAELETGKWNKKGVALLTDPGIGYKLQVLRRKGIGDLSEFERTWDNTLLQMGIPAFYLSAKEARNAKVVAMDGLTAWIPDKTEMKEILSHGVLLDSKAVEVLVARGFEKEIGVSIAGYNKHQTSAEIFHESIIEGIPEKRMPLRIGSERWAELVPLEGSKVASTIVDPKGASHAGTVLYENSLGGRVACYAGCITLGNEFFNHARVSWGVSLLNWLAKRKFPLEVYASQRMLSIRRNWKNKVLLAFANLSTDPMDNICGVIREIGNIKLASIMSDSGEWIKADDQFKYVGLQGAYSYNVNKRLYLYDWIIILIETC